jgi:hypothetical protein
VTLLTRLSWWCGGIFLALSLLLSVMHRGPGGSDIQQRLREVAPAAAPSQSGPSPLEGLTPTPAPSTSAPAAGAPAGGAAAPAAGTPAPATTP